MCQQPIMEGAVEKKMKKAILVSNITAKAAKRAGIRWTAKDQKELIAIEREQILCELQNLMHEEIKIQQELAEIKAQLKSHTQKIPEEEC